MDRKKALELFLVAGNQLHPDGQHSVGHAYDNGFKGSVDLIEAVRWYRRAAYKHQIGAEVQLAQHLLIGRGTPKNANEALVLLKDAVARDHAPAQMTLGLLFEMGGVVPQDRAKALALFSKAAAKNYPDALHQMGLLLQAGVDERRSPHEAAEKFLQAAKKRHIGGARSLAGCYLTGDGVPVDFPRAIAWLRLCAMSGQPSDLARLARVLGACPEAKYRDTKDAVKFSIEALQQLSTDDCPEGPEILETAALAHASDGQFFKAVEFQDRAGKIYRARPSKDVNLAKLMVAESDRRLKSYRNHQPFVATPPKPVMNGEPLTEDRILEDFEVLTKPRNSGP